MSLTTDDKKWIKGAIVEGITEALDTIIMPKFEEIDERFDRMDERLDRMDDRFNRIEGRLDSLEEKVDGFGSKDQSDFSAIHSAIARSQASIEEILETLEILKGLNNDVSEIYTMVAELQKAERKNSKDIAKLREDVEKRLRTVNTQVHKLAAANGITL